nr:ankyrin repeat domain-containing protein [uncultured Noviherbaspirillum sp.]
MITFFAHPSLRPEIDIYSLDHDFPSTPARPVVRTAYHAIDHTVMPKKPAVTQETSLPQTTIAAPSYKTTSSLVAQHSKPVAIANEKTTTSPSGLTSRYTAETFADAVQNGCLESVIRHIEAGLKLNVGAKLYGDTPLMIAAAFGHKAIVQRLIDAGTYVNKVRRDGGTALMIAHSKGHTAIVETLLARGGRWNLLNSDDPIIMMFAAVRGEEALLEALRIQELLLDPSAINLGLTENEVSCKNVRNSHQLYS